MGTRAHDLDINDGGGFLLTLTGESGVSKFGFDYSTVTDLFATLLRIRNTNCEGFTPFPHTLPPFDDNTLMRMFVNSGSTLVPSVGHIVVRDASVFTYSRGVISTGRMEAFEDGVYNVEYKTGTVPTLDGVNINVFFPLVPIPTTRDKIHKLVFINADSGDTETFDVLMHDNAQLFMATP